jgi:hypothetical protein
MSIPWAAADHPRRILTGSWPRAIDITDSVPKESDPAHFAAGRDAFQKNRGIVRAEKCGVKKKMDINAASLP